MKSKLILVLTIPILLIGLITVALWGLGNRGKDSSYVTARVDIGSITQVVTATGSLQAVVTVQVGSQVSGTIAKLYADFNSKVKQGQVVAELDQDKFKAAVEQAKANLLSAQANVAKARVSVEDARRTLERSKELKKRELIAQSELDAAQTAYDAAVAQLEVNKAQAGQAKAALDQASVDLSHTIIRSPVDGIVVSRNVDFGQTVAASLQAPTLFTIANDLAKMEVHTNVDEADVGNVWVGQEVTFTVDAFPTRRFKGKVSQVRNAPNVVQNVVTYDAVVGIDNKEFLLKPGMTVNAEFLVSQKGGVLRIPNVAIRFRPPGEKAEGQQLAAQGARGAGGTRGGRRTGGERARRPAASDGKDGRWVRVYLLKDRQGAPVQLRLGITDGSYTEVLEGEVQEGQPIIIGLSAKAQNNSRPGASGLFGTRGFRGFR